MPANQPDLNEAIDACRLGSQDLSLPELRELAARIDQDVEVRRVFSRCQQLDASIGKAFEDVTVPGDLCEKLLGQFQKELDRQPDQGQPHQGQIAQASQPDVVDQTCHLVGTEQATSNTSQAKVTRSTAAIKWTWMRLGVGAAVAASLFVVVITAAILIQPSGDIPAEHLFQECLEWQQSITAHPFSQEMKPAPSRRYPVDGAIVVAPSGWQSLKTRYDAQAVVYDLRSHSGQSFAALVVIRTNARFAVSQVMQSEPASTTRGISIGACQKGGRLYILMIEGNKKRFQRFVKVSPPVT